MPEPGDTVGFVDLAFAALPKDGHHVGNSVACILPRAGGYEVHKEITASGAAAADNRVALFSFTGPFFLMGIWLIISEATAVTDITNVGFEQYDQNAYVNMTLRGGAGGAVLTGCGVGCLLFKNAAKTVALGKLDSNAGGSDETLSSILGTATVQAKNGVPNVIYLSYDDASTAAVDFDAHVVAIYREIDDDLPCGLVAG